MNPLHRISLSLACALAACGTALPELSRPHILLVSIDSARRDLFSSYGWTPQHAPEQRTSPAFDRLAAEGVLFENASATSSWTLPSHVSLLTGVPELVHAVEQDGQRLSPSLPLLAEILAADGYATRGVYSGPYLDPRYGFERGFESYDSAYGPELEAASEEWARLERSAPGSATVPEFEQAQRRLERASHGDRSAPRVAEAALGHLEELARGSKPFFLFVHFFDPHYDYVPTPEDAQRFDPDYTGELDGRDFINDPRVARFDGARGGRTRVASQRDLEHILALYAAELAATDREVGRMLERLDRLGIAEQTIVVVLSDHGDEFFEHGGLGHRRTLFEEALAVPLVLRYPARLQPGVRVTESVSLTGVVPTLLELARVAPPRTPLGASLLSLLDSSARDRPALGRLVLALPVEETFEVGTRVSKVRCIETTLLESCRVGDLKIVREVRRLSEDESLPVRLQKALADRNRELAADVRLRWIDLAQNPHENEEHDSGDFGDPRAERALAAFRLEYERLLPERRPAESRDSDPQQSARLRGLGYVGSDRDPMEHRVPRLGPPRIPRD